MVSQGEVTTSEKGQRATYITNESEVGTRCKAPARKKCACGYLRVEGAKLWLGMWVIDEISDIGEARGYFESLEQYILTDVEVDNSGEDDLNGMPARLFSGRAKKGRDPVEWAVVFFQAGPQIVSAILYVGVPEARLQRSDELAAIVDSIVPAAR